MLAPKGVPYRIDEMNGCNHGGASGTSGTYASTMWALDCPCWRAAHSILGVNDHTEEAAGQDKEFNGVSGIESKAMAPATRTFM